MSAKTPSAFIRPERRGQRTYYWLVRSERDGARVRSKKIAYLGTSPSIRKKLAELYAELKLAKANLDAWMESYWNAHDYALWDIESSPYIPKHTKRILGGHMPTYEFGMTLRPVDIRKWVQEYYKAREQVRAWQQKVSQIMVEAEKLLPYSHVRYRKRTRAKTSLNG